MNLLNVLPVYEGGNMDSGGLVSGNGVYERLGFCYQSRTIGFQIGFSEDLSLMLYISLQ